MATIVFLGNFRVPYTSETHHALSLESLGHTVVRLQETEIKAEDIYDKACRSDLFVWVHTHGWRTPGRIDMSRVLQQLKIDKIPTMTYHLDLWFGLQRQKDLESVPVYKYIDHFFTVDKQMAEWFNKETDVVGHYLPAGVYDAECQYREGLPQKDIIFVGSRKYHPEWKYRETLISWLERNYQQSFEHYGTGGIKNIRGKELNRLYWNTKIVVGDSLCIDFEYPHYWSDRVYETLGRGGFLIHPYIKGMEQEFTDKTHLVFYEYNNFEQLKELIDYYIKNDQEREIIRKNGHELVKNNYTYVHRWKHILRELKI